MKIETMLLMSMVFLMCVMVYGLGTMQTIAIALK